MRPRRLLAFSCAAAVLLLQGCGSPGGPQRAPALGLEVPPAWSTPQAEAAAQPASGPWWQGFGDEGLDSVVRQALQANQNLALAAARVQQAQAQARIAASALRPQAEAEASAARSRQTLAGFPLPPGPAGGGGGGFISNNFGATLNLGWEADLWNRLGAAADAAQADLRAARAQAQAAQLSLAGQAAKGWFGLLEADRQAELARRTLALRERTVERVYRRYESGLAPSLDLRLARTNAAAAAAQLAARQRALDATRRQLEVLLGRYPRAELAAAQALPEPPPAPPTGVPALLLSRRPDLRAAESRVAAAGGRVEAARAALYPQARLTGALGRQASDVADLLDPVATVWRLAGSLLAPLYDGGRRRAEVELAQGRLAEALADYRLSVLEAFGEAETAMAADRLLREQVQAAERQLRQARAAARLAQERYSAGLVDLLTVFEAERQQLDAAAAALQARRERLQNRVDLHLALGGDFGADSERRGAADVP